MARAPATPIKPESISFSFPSGRNMPHGTSRRGKQPCGPKVRSWRLPSRCADANSNGIRNIIQLARRQVAETVQETRFGNRLYLKGVGSGILRQTVGRRRSQRYEPSEVLIPRFPLRDRNDDLQSQ